MVFSIFALLAWCGAFLCEWSASRSPADYMDMQDWAWMVAGIALGLAGWVLSFIHVPCGWVAPLATDAVFTLIFIVFMRID